MICLPKREAYVSEGKTARPHEIHSDSNVGKGLGGKGKICRQDSTLIRPDAPAVSPAL